MKITLGYKTAAVSIFLAIFSNFLWENIFRDLVNKIINLSLTLSTLGIEKYKDDIYVSVAKGFYENASVMLLTMHTGIISGFIFAAVIIPPVLIKFLKNKGGESSYESEEVPAIVRLFKNNSRTFKAISVFYCVFGLVYLFLMSTRVGYINRTIAYYNQLKTIAAPNLSLEEEEILDAKFSQIGNKSDYVNLVKELRGIITGKGGELPEEESIF